MVRQKQIAQTEASPLEQLLKLYAHRTAFSNQEGLKWKTKCQKEKKKKLKRDPRGLSSKPQTIPHLLLQLEAAPLPPSAEEATGDWP